MAIPGQSLTPTLMWSPFLPPEDSVTIVTATTDIKLGGRALSDGSAGLQVQTWTLSVGNVGLSNSSVSVTDSHGNTTLLFNAPGITWARLAFDQNMHPVVTFFGSLGSGYYWWDPTIPGVTTTYFSSSTNITKVCCSMDDNRSRETNLGMSDVIMAYVANNNLCYRQQRDRYTIEYVLYTNITEVIPNAVVWKIGMNSRYRLQMQIAGNLYQ